MLHGPWEEEVWESLHDTAPFERIAKVPVKELAFSIGIFFFFFSDIDFRTRKRKRKFRVFRIR